LILFPVYPASSENLQDRFVLPVLPVWNVCFYGLTKLAGLQDQFVLQVLPDKSVLQVLQVWYVYYYGPAGPAKPA
jgi:hypothetical protein